MLGSNLTLPSGSNTGIGLETARELARMNATVVLACRSVGRANEAKESILKTTKCSPSKVIVLPLDLCDFDSVRNFVNMFMDLQLPLHGLINNAGMMTDNRSITKVILCCER